MKTKKLAYWASVTTLGIVLGVSLQFVKAWTEPTATAPNGNVGAPINSSSIAQTKAGALVLNTAGAPSGLLVANGNVGIGTLMPNAAKGLNGYATANDVYLSDAGKWASEVSGGGGTTWVDPKGNIITPTPKVVNVKLADGGVSLLEDIIMKNSFYGPILYDNCGSGSAALEAVGYVKLIDGKMYTRIFAKNISNNRTYDSGYVLGDSAEVYDGKTYYMHQYPLGSIKATAHSDGIYIKRNSTVLQKTTWQGTILYRFDPGCNDSAG